jgi:hypothetical protein
MLQFYCTCKYTYVNCMQVLQIAYRLILVSWGGGGGLKVVLSDGTERPSTFKKNRSRNRNFTGDRIS